MSRRLEKEWKDIRENNAASKGFHEQIVLNKQSDIDYTQFPDEDIILFPNTDNSMYYWTVLLRGPDDTPFQNARFRLSVTIPSTYPHSAPKFTFLTTICHPNIDFKTGEICLDILKDNWTPTWSLDSVCRALLVLLGEPEPLSPLNVDCGILVRDKDMRAYWSLVRMYIMDFAVILGKKTSTMNSPNSKISSTNSSSSSSSSSSNNNTSTSKEAVKSPQATTSTEDENKNVNMD